MRIKTLSLQETLLLILKDTESMRNFTVDSQRHWVYKNLYHQFSEALSLQEFKSHTNLNVSSMIRIQVTYNLEKLCV